MYETGIILDCFADFHIKRISFNRKFNPPKSHSEVNLQYKLIDIVSSVVSLFSYNKRPQLLSR